MLLRLTLALILLRGYPAPAQDEIVYETRIFDIFAHRHESVYSSDPSDEVDKAWNDLYNGGSAYLAADVLTNMSRFRHVADPQVAGRAAPKQDSRSGSRPKPIHPYSVGLSPTAMNGSSSPSAPGRM